MGSANEHAHRALDVVDRPLNVPAGEHNLSGLLHFWAIENSLDSWEELVTFVNAASGITNNFGDSWHAYWDALD